jgi:mono/diheme cytochrome c family protein
MRRLLKILGLVLGAVVLLAGGFALYVAIDGIPRYPVEKIDLHVEATPARLERGKKLATLLCAGCHLNPTTRQLTGKHMSDAPPQFGVIYSPNITRHPTKGIGSWTDGELAYLLRTGVKRDGRYAPPWMSKLPHLSDEDLASIIVFLRSDDPLVAPADVDPPGVPQPSFLTKVLCHTVFRKLPYPSRPIVAPPISDRVAHGRYLAVALDCDGCHSADFATRNITEPEKSVGFFGGGNTLRDLRGLPIRSANLTPDEETGIGRWSEENFRRALQDGFRPDGSPLRYPMVPLPELSTEETGAIYAFFRTVPKIRNSVPRQRSAPGSAPTPQAPPPVAGASSTGRELYEKYACVSCHGDNGMGIADLRQASVHYRTRAALEGWIKDAPRIQPGTKMPGFAGVIPEQDFPPLIDYVLQLGAPPAAR